MDIEKVIQELNGRFALPLPEYYHRRIIFWHDGDREFEDKLDEIQLNNAKMVALTGSNTFMVKKLLSHDDLTSNYLVYNPLSFDRPDDDWLIDIKLYSEEFRADLISIWMDEIGMTGKLALPTLIALCSIALGRPVQSSLVVLGEISISGTMIKVDELASTLQVCLDSGAKRVLIPSTSFVDFATVPPDLMSAFQLIPYQSAEDAVFKALGVE